MALQLRDHGVHWMEHLSIFIPQIREKAQRHKPQKKTSGGVKVRTLAHRLLSHTAPNLSLQRE